MDQWALVVVGVAAVAAAWDFGRRVTQKIANAALSARIDTLANRVNDADTDIRAARASLEVTGRRLSSDIATCQSKVLEMDAKLRGLSSKQEMQTAAVRRGFPRIG